MMGRTPDDADPVVVSIDDVRRAYERERERYRSELFENARESVRVAFDHRRAIVRENVLAATTAHLRSHSAAYEALQAYAKRAPNRVVNGRPIKPDVWDWFLSLGEITDMYATVVHAANAAVAALRLRRRWEVAEQRLEDQFKRSLYLHEDAVSKRLSSLEGMREFHARPGVAKLYAILRNDERDARRGLPSGDSHQALLRISTAPS